MNDIYELFKALPDEEKNVMVAEHLKSLSRWNLKRVLCSVLQVDNYMDDAVLRAEFEKIINER